MTGFKSKKRDDVQCLRALAIFAVVAFHLFPKWFSQGFLGVDLFFVISGYLMTSILNFSFFQTSFLAICRDFYVRRVKRIFPAYFLTILVTFLVCSLFLFDVDFLAFKKDVFWSILFVSNFETIFKQETYFQEIGSFNFLLHTWSLAVEIQFYLLAPFLFYLITASKWPKSLVFCFGMASWTLQSFVLSPNLAFGLIFCRIWQFLVGSAAFYAEQTISNPANSSKLSKCLKNSNYILAAFLLILSLILPEMKECWLYPVFMRTLTTVLTGYLIFLGTQQDLVNVPFLTGILSFFGDASYSIYLVHWPIIVLAKYLVIFDQYVIFISILVFVVGILQYKYFELNVQQWSTTTVFIFIKIAVFGILMSMLLPGQQLNTQIGAPKYIGENFQLVEKCKHQLEVLRHCKMDPPFEFPKTGMPIDTYLCSFDGNGTDTYMVTGNSFAMRQVFELMEELNGDYRKIYVAAQSVCTIFLELNLPEWKCDYVSSRLLQIMQLLKPDVTIVSQRLSVFNHPVLASPNETVNDTMTPVFRKYWTKYANFTKKIVIVEPYATLYNTPEESFVKLFRPNANLDDYFVSKQKMEAEVDSGWWRTLASIDECPICSTVTIRHHLCRDEKCDIFDASTNHTIYCDAGHLNPEGLSRITPDIIKAIKTEK